MALKIDQDHSRFRDIIRGKVKENLREFISNGEMTGAQGGERVKIPLPQIDLPHFEFDHRESGGVGQGEGEVGDVLSPGNIEQPGKGQQAGGDPAEGHELELDISIDELAEIMGEVLELPHIEPKGAQTLETEKTKYTGIKTTGPESLRHFKRTYRQALRRYVTMGSYDYKHPRIVPIREDKRYRSWKTKPNPETQAVIIYMMDVSGSMGDKQKEIVRIESFWIDTWLRSQYKGLETRFIIHDAAAKEVDRETFFHTRESGGTMISSAYQLCADLIDEHYPASEYNIYPFHFSDGDNWSGDDTKNCLEILNTRLLPVSNAFCYGQVDSPYGSGQFIKDLRKNYTDDERVILSEIADKNAIFDSIKDFLGAGR